MNPVDRTWTVEEKHFLPQQQHYYETIMTIGNGYLGTRASFEESYPEELASTLIHGIFNHHADDLVPDLANVPSWFDVKITIENQRFRLDEGTLLGYHRALDLRTGILKRGILWQSPTGKVIRIQFERLASMDNQHLFIQRIQLKALSDIDDFSVELGIDPAKALNIAYAADGQKHVSHWANETCGADGYGHFYWIAETNQSAYKVILNQNIQIDTEGYTLTPPHLLDSSISQTVTRKGSDHFALADGDELTIVRVSCIATSRDAGDLVTFSSKILRQASEKQYQTLVTESTHVWNKLWEDFDIVIEGDELAQLAIRFVTYHLLIAAPRNDDRVSIGAKTLSGPGYKGHVFWDTELFMLPPFTLSRPDIARNLLMYRYHNLAGAREKAAEAGYKGAMFPWESTDTGQETTPRWTLPDKNGKRIRIWNGDNEQHISSDIAFAVWQYWQWTGDDDFLENYGAEIILDTAVFWGSRVEWNQTEGRYELTQQVGPDEFHENIDNPVYTNALVAWHMEQAIKAVEWLKQGDSQKAQALQARLGIDSAMLEQWQHIANHMYLPRHNALNVYEQFDSYFDLNYIDVPAYSPRTTSLDVILGHERKLASQVIKQADVVMMMVILGDRVGNKEEMLRNWHTYLPRTAHDSSLSPAVHSWVAAKLGLLDEAYDLWMQSAGLDLENNKGNVRDGIHAAACGGLRQAIMFGFAGLTLNQDGTDWSVNPNLPIWWKSIQFTFYFKGKRQVVTVD